MLDSVVSKPFEPQRIILQNNEKRKFPTMYEYVCGSLKVQKVLEKSPHSSNIDTRYIVKIATGSTKIVNSDVKKKLEFIQVKVNIPPHYNQNKLMKSLLF